MNSERCYLLAGWDWDGLPIVKFGRGPYGRAHVQAVAHPGVVVVGTYLAPSGWDSFFRKEYQRLHPAHIHGEWYCAEWEMVEWVKADPSFVSFPECATPSLRAVAV